MNTIVAQQLPNLEQYGVESDGGMLKGPEADNQLVPQVLAYAPSVESGYVPRIGVLGTDRVAPRNHKGWGTRVVLAGGGLLTAACTTAPSAGVVSDTQSSENTTTQERVEADLKSAGFDKVSTDMGIGNVWVRGEGMTTQTATGFLDIGSRVVKQAIGQKIVVELDGVKVPVTLALPDGNVPRAYAVYTDPGPSLTEQYFDPKTGKLLAASGQISVDNSPGTPGAFTTTTTEICQGMIMTGVNPAKERDRYLLVKEGACNSLGIVADRAAVKYTYAEYAEEERGAQLKDVSNGHDLKVTVFDKEFFAAAQKSLTE